MLCAECWCDHSAKDCTHTAEFVVGGRPLCGHHAKLARGGKEPCYINGCEQEAAYLAEEFPLGTRVTTCAEHIAQAANYFTTSHRPLLVIPLRFT